MSNFSTPVGATLVLGGKVSEEVRTLFSTTEPDDSETGEEEMEERESFVGQFCATCPGRRQKRHTPAAITLALSFGLLASFPFRLSGIGERVARVVIAVVELSVLTVGAAVEIRFGGF
jgi:hypothetical protein